MIKHIFYLNIINLQFVEYYFRI